MPRTFPNEPACMKKKQAMDANMGVGGGRPVAQQREGTGPIPCRQLLFVTSIGMETEPRTLSTNQRGMGNYLSAYTATLTLTTSAKSQHSASEPADLEKRT
jgi:hypothetical protein